MIIARYGMALFLALVVTLLLFFLMQHLIATTDQQLDNDTRGYTVDFIELEREEVVRQKKIKPKKPPPPEAPPPEPPAPKLDNIQPRAEKIVIVSVPIKTDIELSAEGFSLSAGDGEYLPIVKVKPIYPRRALTRGIEGYVILEFTVTKTGSVKDIKVVDSQPKTSIFHKVSIKAAEKFKYKPRIIDGEAVEVYGVQNKITFVIEK